ncbi:MAG: PQQ-binding-like beta-propeller repeat protein [Planctomycetota bacterium]
MGTNPSTKSEDMRMNPAGTLRSAGWALVLAWATAPLLAQDPLDAGPPEGLFSLPRSQADIAEWQEARREIDERRYEAAVERLHRLLRNGSRGVVPRLGTRDRWTGIRTATIETLRDLPEAGRAAYERLCRREAGRAYDTPLADLSDEDLAFLAGQFPASARGLSARLRLGDLGLIDGDGVTAQAWFRTALDAMPADDPRREVVIRRAEVAELLARASLGVTRATTPTQAEIVPALPAVAPPGWTAYGGGYDGSRAMTPPIGRQEEPYRLPVRADGFEFNDFPMHATGDARGIYFQDGHSVRAVDPIGRRVMWDAPGPMVDSSDVVEARGAINPDTILSCALSDRIVVAALQVPNNVIGADQTQLYRDVIPILQKIPSRRLFAFDRATGKRLWAHWDYAGGPRSSRFYGHEACSAPLVHGDTVYVPTHDPTGAIAYYVSAYDLHTGEPRWRRLICSSQQEVNMFGNARQEFTSGPIALHDGVLYGTSNLGLCYAIQADDGELRWLSAYPVIPLPRTQLRNQERRPVFFANNPIAIHQGVLATTPLDSEFALGLDVATGEILWQLPYDPRPDLLVRWLLGPLGDEFVFAGLGVMAVRARPDPGERPKVRLIASPESLGEDHYRSTAIPRGALAADRIYFVGSDGGLRILDANGDRDPRMGDWTLGGKGTGNLLLVDGIVTAIGRTQLQVFADVEALIAAARRDVRGDDPEPDRVLHLARLLMARGEDDPNAVETLLARGLEAAARRGLGAGSPVHEQLADGLFRLTMDRARAAPDDATARELLRKARERATTPSHWLRAQTELLRRSFGSEEAFRTELFQLAERFPEESMVFPEYGRTTAAILADWLRIDVDETPSVRALALQRFAERHGDARFGERSAAARARSALDALVAEFGEEVLAAIESEARIALALADDDTDALRALALRYPRTRAASSATDRLLDVALAAGDFRRFTEVFAAVTEGLEAPAGALRRLVAAAQRGGNPALAHAVARRLVERFGDRTSDFPADRGASLADALRGLEAPPGPANARPRLPRTTVLELEPGPSRAPQDFVPVQVADGFPEPAALPLAISPAEGELRFYSLDAGATDADRELGLATIRGALDGRVLLCGDVAVVVDAQRAFGFDLTRREELWTLPGDHPGSLTALGTAEGLLLLYAFDDAGRGAGGRLLGVEPRSGSVLHTTRLVGDGAPLVPVLQAGQILRLRTDGPEAPAVDALDALTGTLVETTPLRVETLDALGVAEGRRLQDPTFRGSIFADAAHIYLPADLGNPEDRSRLVAVERGTGRTVWRHESLPGCSFQRAGLRDGRVVAFEKGAVRSRLVVLGADGVAEAEFEFGTGAAVRNWDRFPHPEAPPPVVVVTDVAGTARVTAVSVAPDGPRFQPEIGRVDRIARDPLVGDGYLLVPCARSRGASPRVLVFDLASGGTAGALPGGESLLTLDVPSHASFHAHGRHLVVKTLDSIRVLGDRE